MQYRRIRFNSGAGTIAAPFPAPIGTHARGADDAPQAEAPTGEATLFGAIGEVLSDLAARLLSSGRNGTSGYGCLVLDTPHRMAPSERR